MSGYPKATCDPGTVALRLANERADRWKQRHDALAGRLASVEALADKWQAEVRNAQAHGTPNPLPNTLSSKRAHARAIRAALGSDAHTEQKGTGE